MCVDCGCPLPPSVGRGRPRKRCADCRPQYKRGDSGICPVCGTEFELVKRRGIIPTYCSRKCSIEVFQRKKRAPKLSNCLECGREFERPNGQTKICSPACTQARNSRKYHEKRRAEVGDPYEMTCLYCGQEFTVDPKTTHVERKYCRKVCAMQAGREARRARIRGLPYERIDRQLVYRRDGWMCGLCKEPVSPMIRWPDPMCASIDHIVPISRGGGHTYENVQCAHLICNLRAQAKDYEYGQARV